MKNILWILAIIGSVGIAALADSVSVLWVKGESKISIYLLFLFFLGPLVFITFGLVTTKSGLAIASGVVNSLLVLSSISVGLFIFGEWSRISILQYIGMGLAVAGIALMLFFPKNAS